MKAWRALLGMLCLVLGLLLGIVGPPASAQTSGASVDYLFEIDEDCATGVQQFSSELAGAADFLDCPAHAHVAVDVTVWTCGPCASATITLSNDATGDSQTLGLVPSDDGSELVAARECADELTWVPDAVELDASGCALMAALVSLECCPLSGARKCEELLCDLMCPYGFKVDEFGCLICECQEGPDN